MKIFLSNAINLLNRSGSAESLEIVSDVREEFPPSTPEELVADIEKAVRRTQAWYLDQQHPEGYWWRRLDANVTIVAEYLMLLHFLGIRDDVRDRRIINHIARNQRSDGTWSLYFGGPADLSTTVEAYFALKLAGFPEEQERMQQARRFILEKGGVEACRVFTRIYLALFGEFPWDSIPSIPVEINLFPAWFPLNIYNFSSWARCTIVPLSLVLDKRPVRRPPGRSGIRELYARPGSIPAISKELAGLSWKRIFVLLDRFMKTVDGVRPLRPLRKRALRRAEQWVLEHQEPSGDWGGIQPAMVNAILALTALGYPPDSGPVRKGLEALHRFAIHTEDELTLQSCISPVWDTALTSHALLSSGVRRDHPALMQAAGWLASKQVFRKGDWSVKLPNLPPGGWAFEFENGWYPDVDDSSVALLLLKGYAPLEVIGRENLYRGLHWVLGMQNRDGGWGAFDVDNDMKVFNQLLFGDLEAMIDPSTPDLTGRVLEMLGCFGFGMANEVVRRAVSFIKRNQEKDGSWWGRWGVNRLYGTSTVLNGLQAVGEDLSRPYVQKAVRWLKSGQNRDGGWGESCASYYETPSNRCLSTSTPSQTGWALLALIAAGETASVEVQNGVSHLLERQNSDGTWDEEEFTGTGFPKHFYLRYENYRNCFPLLALGKFLSTTRCRENRP